VLPDRTEARQESLHAFRITEAPHATLAIQYSLKRWEALTRCVVDGHVPIEQNLPKARLVPRPQALGRSNGLFVGLLVYCEREDHIAQLLPYHWRPLPA
jgi:transposase